MLTLVNSNRCSIDCTRTVSSGNTRSPCRKRTAASCPWIFPSVSLRTKARPSAAIRVARDLSERKKNEQELKRARDELSRYSQDLERQVRERTRAITSILHYTPAVVYLKDRNGRYKLVNPRFEELLGIKNEHIQGKSDHDIFPPAMAA